jgi:predicted dehydrogenase
LVDNKNIRWGIIGCGNVTELKSGPAYQKTDGFELIAVMRRSPGMAKDYAQRHGVEKYYTDADALINDPDVDAVYIATPPDTHKLYGLKVASVKKPCCIEKPLSTNYIDSLTIYNAFNATKTPLFVAYYRRALPRFIKLKSWIDEGKVGTVRHIQWQLCKVTSEQDLSGEYNWRTDARVAPGGYFDDLASHGLDLFCSFFGEVSDAAGVSLNQQKLYTAKDAVTGHWLHDNNITGMGNWNFGSNKSEDKVTIYGSLGTIQFSVFDEQPIELKSDKVNERLYISHPENVQLHHVEQMRDQLLDPFKNHPSSGQTGSHTSWVMDKILGVI